MFDKMVSFETLVEQDLVDQNIHYRYILFVGCRYV